jgi:hypothetical protein
MQPFGQKLDLFKVYCVESGCYEIMESSVAIYLVACPRILESG